MIEGNLILFTLLICAATAGFCLSDLIDLCKNKIKTQYIVLVDFNTLFNSKNLELKVRLYNNNSTQKKSLSDFLMTHYFEHSIKWELLTFIILLFSRNVRIIYLNKYEPQFRVWTCKLLHLYNILGPLYMNEENDDMRTFVEKTIQKIHKEHDGIVTGYLSDDSEWELMGARYKLRKISM